MAEPAPSRRGLDCHLDDAWWASRGLRRPHAATSNIQAIAKLESQLREGRTWADRLGAGTTRVAGTMTFVGLHVGWFGVWLAVNLGGLAAVKPFDPPPFSLLALVVSLEAIFLALFVLISQNRMSREADRRAQLDLQINLLAEQENTAMLAMLHRICEHLRLDMDHEDEMQQLREKTDIDQLAGELDKALPSD